MTQLTDENISKDIPSGDLSATPAIDTVANPEQILSASDADALAETASKMPPPTPADLAIAASKKVQRSERTGPLPIGTEMGHFVVERYIGGGGMGRVYLAHDTALDRKVAIKVLPKQRAHDRATVARFMNEARSAARLNHEHIAQVYFAHEYQGTPYIAFEYVEGVNMRDVVNQQGAFTVVQTLNYAIQITYALNHIYAHGVVHRDIKPSNILITPLGKAKLIDMGLARLLNSSIGAHDLTASGVTLGTFDYISPEQARDPRGADIRSDIYSLGCTIFFMLTGRPPFPEGTVLQKLLQHQGDEPPSLHDFIPEISHEVVHITQKMMAKDPRQRYQNPQALLQALSHAAVEMGLRPANVNAGQSVWVERFPSKQAWWRRHLSWVIPAALLVLTFLAMTIWDRQHPTSVPNINPPLTLNKSPLLPSAISTPSSPTSTAPNLVSPRVDYSSVRVKIIRASSYELMAGILFPAKQSPQNSHGISFSSGAGGITLDTVQAMISPFLTPSLVNLGGGFFEPRAIGAMIPLPKPQAMQPKPAEPTFIVDLTGAIAGSYKSLAAALAVAPDGSTIELCFNGVIKLAPFTIPAKRLRIVAGTHIPDPKIGNTGDASIKRYSPILAFDGDDSGITAMMTVDGGDITFEDITFEMTIPATPSPWWSLVEITQRAKLTWRHCVITVRNLQLRSNVAIVRSVNSILPTRGESTEISPVSLTWENSILRGETSWLVWNSDRGVRLIAENCFVALESAPFVLEATARSATSEKQIVNSVNIDFSFVTLVTPGALWQETQKSLATTLMPHQMLFSGCVMVLSASPMIDISSEEDLVDIKSLCKWTTGKFPNFFQGVETWAKISNAYRSDMITQDSLSQYVHFSLETQRNVLKSSVLESLIPQKKFHAMHPSDFSLQQSANNPALKIDTTRYAGANESALPAIPTSW